MVNTQQQSVYFNETVQEHRMFFAVTLEVKTLIWPLFNPFCDEMEMTALQEKEVSVMGNLCQTK